MTSPPTAPQIAFIVTTLSLGLPTLAAAQDPFVLADDQVTALRLLSIPPPAPASSDAALPTPPPGWRFASVVNISTDYANVEAEHGVIIGVRESLFAVVWGEWGWAHAKLWFSPTLAGGANPRLDSGNASGDGARDEVWPYSGGLVAEAFGAWGDDLGVWGSARLDGGYEGFGTAPSALFGAHGDGVWEMTGSAPMSALSSQATGGFFFRDGARTQHRLLAGALSARRLDHWDARAPTSSLSELGAGFSIYGQRVAWDSARDTGFDILPVRFLWLDLDGAVRPTQRVIDIRAAQGQALLHTTYLTFRGRAHLGWRFVSDGQRLDETLSLIAALSLGLDFTDWGLAVEGTRDAAPGADGAGMIAQNQAQARLSIRPLTWPVSLEVSGAYARLSDMEFQSYDDDAEAPSARRAWLRVEAAWTAWRPWYIAASWTAGVGPAPDRTLWRPWALPSQRYDLFSLSVGWSFAIDEVR